MVVDDDATGRRLADGLGDLGYACVPELVMTLSARATASRRPASRASARPEELRAVERAFMRERGPRARTSSRSSWPCARAVAGTAGTRWFVAEAEGRAGASATLYSDGAVAQVEDVGTCRTSAAAAWGRAVSARLDAAVPPHELVFLTADADDWPHRLYAHARLPRGRPRLGRACASLVRASALGVDAPAAREVGGLAHVAPEGGVGDDARRPRRTARRAPWRRRGPGTTTCPLVEPDSSSTVNVLPSRRRSSSVIARVTRSRATRCSGGAAAEAVLAGRATAGSRARRPFARRLAAERRALSVRGRCSIT